MRSKTYDEYFDRYQNYYFRFYHYYLRVYVQIHLIFVSSCCQRIDWLRFVLEQLRIDQETGSDEGGGGGWRGKASVLRRRCHTERAGLDSHPRRRHFSLPPLLTAASTEEREE